MGYLRDARFARVREALRCAKAAENVTGIAMSLGFTHMGRFSVEYRKRFGESPSETLKQRRGVPPPTPRFGGPNGPKSACADDVRI